jgi:hypothetical protein
VRSVAESVGFMLPQLQRPDVVLFYAEPDPGEHTDDELPGRMSAYGGMRREQAALRASGRLRYAKVSDAQAREMQRQISELEGFAVSLEDSRAVAVAAILAGKSTVPCDIVALVA